jgi:methionine synthase I (cobalamin-dependent)
MVVQIFLVETIFDTLNAKAALFAIDEIQERNIKIPLWFQEPLPMLLDEL